MAARRRLAAALSSARGALAGRLPRAPETAHGSAPAFRGVSSLVARPSPSAGRLLSTVRMCACGGVPILGAGGAAASRGAALAPIRFSHSSATGEPTPPVVLASRPSPSTLVLTLSRPAALNALNDDTMHALVSAAAAADADGVTRAIIITGGPCPPKGAAFAAGADVRELAGHTYASACATRLLDGWRALKHVRLPLIAAVEGYALGGGCELAAACDLVIAGAGASFGQPEVGLGLVPGMGATARLPRAVGKAVAMDMILTGRRLSAGEALAAGLVSRVVPDGETLAEAVCAAATVARAPRAAVAKAKELTNAAFEMPLAAGLETELREFWACFGTGEQVEGCAAFLEKRAPRWGG